MSGQRIGRNDPLEAVGGDAHPGGPLFLLSFRHRDELAGISARAGWTMAAARRADDLPGHFATSGSRIAVVDARGALEEGLDATAQLAPPIAAAGGALIVLLSRGDVRALDRVHDAGATHYLASPFGEIEFVQSLRFAERHVARLAGPDSAEPVSSRTKNPTSSAPSASPIPSFARFMRLLDRLDRRARPEDPATADQEPVRGRDNVGSTDDPNTDPLTGLPDGNAARQWITAQGAHGGTLLLLAINRFDAINAAYGWETGNALLDAAARRIERVMRDFTGPDALLARGTGVEFMLGLPASIGIEAARRLAAELAAVLGRPFVADGRLLTLGVHAGLAELDGGEDASRTLRRAASALAAAREGEGEPVAFLIGNDARDEELAQRLEADLREALSSDAIEILFQPQVALPGGQVEGVEALARWRHPRLGWLGAETLFAAAERAGLLLPLSREVQGRAVAIAAAWPDALARLRLSVNVTAADIAQPDFAERLLRMVDDHGFPRERLTVEITESGLIADLETAANLLARLRAGGCRVAIDDFGTGYSSLAYLKALPLDYLKIDKRLAQDIAGSARDRVVVRGVIDMARSLGLRVIAEGVETPQQLALLATEGCTSYQGFLCAGPLPVAGVEALVLSGGCRHAAA